MESINIRHLKKETTTVLARVALGESLVIRRRNKPLAILRPIATGISRMRRPDFRQRLRDVYGDRALAVTATGLLAENRAERGVFSDIPTL